MRASVGAQAPSLERTKDTAIPSAATPLRPPASSTWDLPQSVAHEIRYISQSEMRAVWTTIAPNAPLRLTSERKRYPSAAEHELFDGFRYVKLLAARTGRSSQT